MKMPLYQLVILFLASLFSPLVSNACSMYKITKEGKTIVGNNEDWISPNSQFWYERAAENQRGVMYMGFLDDFAQGAINDAGLVFDGFVVPYLAIENTEGKQDVLISDAIKLIMRTMSTIDEVKEYLETINLTSLTSSQLVFVDRTGTYLIVEGDEIVTGKEAEKSFSNFYYSQVPLEKDVPLDYFQRGQSFLNATQGQPSLEYCAEAMENFAGLQLAATQYSTIYDLNTLKIRVYLFHDYTQFVEIDLKEELQKENHDTMIADLFPKESIGYQHYQVYNNEERPTQFLEDRIGSDQVTEAEFTAMGFNTIINLIGYEWLKEKNNPTGAIRVFAYGVQLMPNDPNLYDSLGEAYYANKSWDDAIKSYAKSLTLNARNENAIEMIVKIVKNRKESEK